MNEDGWIYDWTLMLLKDFREPLLSFELIYLRNSFCYTIENSRGFRYKILSHVGPFGKKKIFFVSLGIAEILRFSELSVYIRKLSYSKPFHNTLNYASTANIEEVLKFYNLGDKTFSTEFNSYTKTDGLWKLETFDNTIWRKTTKISASQGLLKKSGEVNIFQTSEMVRGSNTLTLSRPITTLFLGSRGPSGLI